MSLLTRFHTYVVRTATHVFVVYLSFIFLVELFHSSCVTVKQGPRKSSCLIPSRQSILLFLFKLLMTPFSPALILLRLLQIFDSLSEWNFTTFLCVPVTQVSCNGMLIVYKWTLSSNSSTLICVTVVLVTFFYVSK